MKICELFGLKFKDDVKIMVEKDVTEDCMTILKRFVERIKHRFNLTNVEIVTDMIYLGQKLAFTDSKEGN